MRILKIIILTVLLRSRGEGKWLARGLGEGVGASAFHLPTLRCSWDGPLLAEMLNPPLQRGKGWVVAWTLEGRQEMAAALQDCADEASKA